MSSAVLSRFACSDQAAASSRQCTTDDLFDLETISEEMGQWNNWQQQKSSRGGQSYHSLQAQVKELKTLVAEVKQSPVQESSRSSSSLPLSAAAQSAFPSGQQQHQLHVNLAQLKKWKASCTDQETKRWLDTRILELQLQLSRGSPRLSRSSPPRRRRRRRRRRISKTAWSACRDMFQTFVRRSRQRKPAEPAVRETVSHLQTKLLAESAPPVVWSSQT